MENGECLKLRCENCAPGCTPGPMYGACGLCGACDHPEHTTHRDYVNWVFSGLVKNGS